jgi:hypothetical protein
MTLGKNVRVLRLISGEIIVTEIKETMDDGMYVLEYPALVIPIPPQQAGGQQGQIGFAKFMPFSDYGEDIIFNPIHIVSDTTPHKQIQGAYDQWSQQTRGQDSGIIVPNMRQPADIPTQGQANGGPNFNRGLNIG